MISTRVQIPSQSPPLTSNTSLTGPATNPTASTTMDSTTVTFVLALVVAFIFLRWFVNSEEEPDFHGPTPTRNASTTGAAAAADSGDDDDDDDSAHIRAQPRRQVTTDMVDVVKQLAPHVSEAQIRHDLLRSGSVEATVDRILSEGTLPFPPGYTASTATSTTTTATTNSDTRNKSKIQPENLMEKYGVDDKANATGTEKKMQWSENADERAKTLQEKKAEMILRARRRLEAQLSNQQDLSGLMK